MSKADKTKQYIIEKTAPVFNTKGFAGTSLNDITSATGLTKGSIYGNFENKDEVAMAAFDHNYGLVVKMVRDKMDSRPHPLDKLKVYLTLYSEFTKIPSLQGGCPVLNTAIEADDTHPGLRARAAAAIDNWIQTIVKIIKAGQDKGQVKQGPDAKEFATAFIALIEGGIMMTKVTGRMDSLKGALKQAEKMIADITP